MALMTNDKKHFPLRFMGDTGYWRFFASSNLAVTSSVLQLQSRSACGRCNPVKPQNGARVLSSLSLANGSLG